MSLDAKTATRPVSTPAPAGLARLRRGSRSLPDYLTWHGRSTEAGPRAGLAVVKDPGHNS